MEDIHNEASPRATEEAVKPQDAAIKPAEAAKMPQDATPAMYQPLTSAMADEPEDEDDFLASVPRSVWGDEIEI